MDRSPVSSPVVALDDEEYKSDKKETLKKFIMTYEMLTELWNPTNVNYDNNNKRKRALEILLPIYANIKPAATLQDVRRKINTLRCNYRKEKKKIISSDGQVYKSGSWVFHSLKFLDNLESPLPRNEQPNESQNSVAGTSRIPLASTTTATAPITDQHLPTLHLSSLAPAPPPQKRLKRKLETNEKRNEFMEKFCNFLKQRPSTVTEEILPETQVWSKKLKGLQPTQRLFAEKAINDVLFEGQLGNLHRHSVKINEPSHSPIDKHPL